MVFGLPWIIIQQERSTNCIIWIFSHQHSHIGNDLEENIDKKKINIVFLHYLNLQSSTQGMAYFIQSFLWFLMDDLNKGNEK